MYNSGDWKNTFLIPLSLTVGPHFKYLYRYFSQVSAFKNGSNLFMLLKKKKIKIFKGFLEWMEGK